jgi:hypothetical protein
MKKYMVIIIIAIGKFSLKHAENLEKYCIAFVFSAKKKWLLLNLGDREGLMRKLVCKLEFFSFSFSLSRLFTKRT